ncbi:MAG: hypothetical protein GY725_21470 [bacterium]|nr:hypothetical protein [bacterium]
MFVYAQINARVAPLDRGERYEDPLIEALADKGFGEVSGGGTMQSRTGEIEYCGVDIELSDPDTGMPFVAEFLAQCGAPRGSELQYDESGAPRKLPFGFLEGLGLYLNGTDLPDNVYQECDASLVYDRINELLGDRGEIQGHWQGPTETALYLYGYSKDEMNGLIAEFVAGYPLCDRARLVTIA